MLRPGKTLLTTLALPAATAGAAGAAPQAASAAGNPYTAEQVCGPNYHLSRQIPLMSNNGPVQMGWTKVLYGGPKGKTCLVNLKVRQVGRPTFTSISGAGYVKNPLNTRWRRDEGNFSYYAGPLYFDATPACVRVGGFMSVPNGREGIFVEGGYGSKYC